MEKRVRDEGVERPRDLPGVSSGPESVGDPAPAENEPDEWRDFGTGDPAFFIKASDDE